MRYSLLFIGLLIGFWGVSQPAAKPYWQQKMVYNITARVLPNEHTIKGNLHLQYINESPDTLGFIWFHLWANAQANDSTAVAKQIRDMNLQSALAIKSKDSGCIYGLDWQVNGTPAYVDKHSTWIDVVKLILPQPLLPGAIATITTPFTTVLPAYTFRSGYKDSALYVAHWYPKPAVYDRKGWHPMPYLEIGEYYSEFGKYSVDITVPGSYVVAATGELKNIDELEHYRQLGRLNHSFTSSVRQKKLNVNDTTLQNTLANYGYTHYSTTKTLRYAADSVHDFAFFTNPQFIIDYDTVRLPSGQLKDVFSFYQKRSFPEWNATVNYATKALLFYSKQVGNYPHQVLSTVQGPEGESFAGIEYQTITLVLSNSNRTSQQLEQVVAHEIGHNWFYGMLASNEREYGWMDEGFNTFFELRYGLHTNRFIPFINRLPPLMAELSDVSRSAKID